MNPLQFASTLNNDGVSLLQQDDLQGSIRLFQQALTVIQELTLNSETEAPMTPSLPCTWLPSFIAQSPQTLKDSPDEVGYFLYNRPFLIVSELLAPLELSTATVDVIGAHVLFNFCLAWQQFTVTLGCESALRRTTELYDILLQIAGRRVDRTYARSFTALTCLVFNNLAHLHHEQCCYKESTMCIDIMLNILHDMQGLEHYLQPHELSRMVWNAVHNEPPTLASAA